MSASLQQLEEKRKMAFEELVEAVAEAQGLDITRPAGREQAEDALEEMIEEWTVADASDVLGATEPTEVQQLLSSYKELEEQIEDVRVGTINDPDLDIEDE